FLRLLARAPNTRRKSGPVRAGLFVACLTRFLHRLGVDCTAPWGRGPRPTITHGKHRVHCRTRTPQSRTSVRPGGEVVPRGGPRRATPSGRPGPRLYPPFPDRETRRGRPVPP